MIIKTTLKAQAYEHLKKGIFDGEFKSDTLYSEQFFADYLNISRTPVREAILQLAKEHYIEIFPNRGVMIKSIDSNSLVDVSQFRSAIESYCTAYLTENSNTLKGKEVIKHLKRICKAQEKLLLSVSEDDHSLDVEWFDLDMSFHQAINDFPNNNRISETMSEINSYIKYIGILTAGIKHRKRESIDENYRIIEAIEKGDAVAAYDAAKFHVEQICKRLLDSDIL